MKRGNKKSTHKKKQIGWNLILRTQSCAVYAFRKKGENAKKHHTHKALWSTHIKSVAALLHSEYIMENIYINEENIIMSKRGKFAICNINVYAFCYVLIISCLCIIFTCFFFSAKLILVMKRYFLNHCCV